MKKGEAAYDGVAGLYDRVFDSMDARRREFAWFLKQARLSPGDTVLDVGCGNGRLLQAIAPSIKAGIGLDVSADMIGCAQKNLRGVRHVRVLKTDGRRFPLPAASVDLVVSFFSFRYLEGERTLKECFRVLKPLGRIIVIDMFRAPSRPAHPLAPAAGKARWLAYFLARPGKLLALRRLVTRPGWRSMLAAHPLAGLEGFRELVTHYFTAPRFVFLDRGRRACTVGFHSGPVGVSRRAAAKKLPALAVMDWGVGGLGFYRALKRRFPRTPVLYLSDSGFTPYGKCSVRRLRGRLRRILAFLEKAGVERLVIACNAMSTALDGFRPASRVSITGVIRPALDRLSASAHRVIGVIGGRRTIRSRAFSRGLAGSGRRVIERGAQPLSGFVERGDIASPQFKRALERILAPLRGVGALVLACTHYRAAEKAIRAALGPGVELIDPDDAALDWAATHWRAALAARPASGAGGDVFFTTGDRAATATAAGSMFGVRIKEIHPLEW